MDHLKNAAFGWMSNSAAICVCNPFEVIRSQAQITASDTSLPKLIKDVYKVQGVKGFYKGIGASLATQPTFWLLYMPTYEYLKKTYSNVPTFITSNVAGAVGTLLTNPLWVLRARMQTEVLRGEKIRYSTFFQTIVKNEGVKSLWKGGGIALLKNLQLGIQLPLYEWLRKDGDLNPFISGLISKSVASSVVYPLDVIRTNVRTAKGYVSFKEMTMCIYNRNGGLYNFYRGIPLYYLSQIPTFAITMVVFESLRQK